MIREKLDTESMNLDDVDYVIKIFRSLKEGETLYYAEDKVGRIDVGQYDTNFLLRSSRTRGTIHHSYTLLDVSNFSIRKVYKKEIFKMIGYLDE